MSASYPTPTAPMAQPPAPMMMDNLPLAQGVPEADFRAADVMVEDGSPPPPVRVISADALHRLSTDLMRTFANYKNDRQLIEQKWLRNLRQYLGIYDPQIEGALDPNRSRAYPRLTRVKCISVVSRVMNLMFPGNERNWSLDASPSADMAPEDVQEAVRRLQAEEPAAPEEQEPQDPSMPPQPPPG